MTFQNKKALIIQYDPYFSNMFLEVLKNSDMEIVLANTLYEGETMLKKALFGLVIIEYPVIISSVKVNKFLSQPLLANTTIFLAAKEKNFLDGIEGKNILKLDYTEITFNISEFIKKNDR